MFRLPLLACAVLLGGLASLGCSLDTSGLGSGMATGGESADPLPTTLGSGTAEGADTLGASGSATSGDPTTTGDDPASTTDPTTTGDDTASSTDPDPPQACTPLLVEALTSLDGADDEREWVVLHNPCDEPLDLGSLSLAWGGFDYDGTIDLLGVIPAGDCVRIGGPTSNGGNFNPTIDQPLDFEPNLSREPGAIGLFLSAAVDVDVGDVPLDVVIYGDSNAGGFLDPDGAMPGPMVGGNLDLVSMRRTSAGPTWEMADPPTPNACPRF